VKGTDYSATYLPEVAVEQKWTKKEAVIHLCKKAGFFCDAEGIWNDIKVRRY